MTKLQRLKEIVEHQSNLNIWPAEKVRLSEGLLAAALRHLHAVIEDDEVAEKLAKQIYWDVDSEL